MQVLLETKAFWGSIIKNKNASELLLFVDCKDNTVNTFANG